MVIHQESAFRRTRVVLTISALVMMGCSRYPSMFEADPRDMKSGVLFYGMCDASGAVPLTSDLFAAADDEDNILRVYSASRGGMPVYDIDLSPSLNLHRIPKKDTRKGFKKPPETDLEAATRIGVTEFWITSHGLNASGKLKPERFHFFATQIPKEGDDRKMPLVGQPYTSMLNDLASDARYRPFKLKEAAERTPKNIGGLNIEGMTERVEGGLFIGFRNPIPEGKSLIAVLENPNEVIHGDAARFGNPIRLDLGGLGIRAMSRWKERYLIIAGSYAGGGEFRLFTWDGRSPAAQMSSIRFGSLNPEGFFTPEDSDRIMLLSDDGEKSIGGVPCKRLKEPRQKTFRGTWISDL